MNTTTILVVEDNRAIFRVIKVALTTHPEHHGYQYQVLHAEDGVDGLHQAWLYEPQIILLDIDLPLLNGYEVLKSLRSRGNTTPVIMMTAHTGQEEYQRGIEVGCNAYLTKPFKPSSLHNHIQELLEREKTKMEKGQPPMPQAIWTQRRFPHVVYTRYERS